MKTRVICPSIIAFTLLVGSAFAQSPTTAAPTAVPASQAGRRLTFPLEADWSFHLYAPDETAVTSWEAVNLPHDWSITMPFEQGAPAGGGGAWAVTGRAVYRKSFTLPAEDQGKYVEIQFDSIMANGEVFINGHSFGVRPYGYVTQHFDLTPYLKYGPGQLNTLYVNVNNSVEPSSRYYTGSGIERHVRLVVTDPVHVETWGLYVTTKDITPLTLEGGLGGIRTATIHFQATVTNQSKTPRTVTVQPTLIGPDGNPAAIFEPGGRALNPLADVTIAPGQSAAFDHDIVVTSPKLWDLDNPNLYRVVATVMESGKPIDNTSTTLGIRKIEFKPETGFWLNGKNVKILGVCVHEDGGAFGEAVPRSVYEERFAALKALGVNAIRMAHNPPNPVELDVCDQLGLLVMDEMFDVWTVAKPPATRGYELYFRDWSIKDEHDAVMRDRNHPSIVFWSTGNEIHDTPQTDLAKGILPGLVAAIHEVDSTRFVTQALFRPNHDDMPAATRPPSDYQDGLADMLDVIGTNYRHQELEVALEDKPTRTGVITEENQDAATWVYIRDHPRISGCFLWAGIDYLGEARAWPSFGAGAGLIDRTLMVKANGYQRDAWWNTKPVVHIVRAAGGARGGAPAAAAPVDGAAPAATGAAPAAGARGAPGVADWTPANTDAPATVNVYSNCDEVELFLNGQSLGTKTLPADASPRTWRVDYAPGTLRAVGRNGGKEVANDELHTAGAAAKIVLTADHTRASPSFDDVIMVRATVVDDKGVRVPSAQNQITFKTGGPGVIVVTDNGSSTDHTLFSSPTRAAQAGNCVAFVRATGTSGKITVTATADGLADGTLPLYAVPATPEE